MNGTAISAENPVGCLVDKRWQVADKLWPTVGSWFGNRSLICQPTVY